LNFTKIKLGVYAIYHFGCKWAINPVSIPKHIKKANISVRHGGVGKLLDDIFRGYLPKKYLLKTKLHIREPSTSILSKIRIYQSAIPINKAKNNTNHIDVNISILVIRSGAMGDVILVTPIIKLLHHKYNGLCKITVATRYPDIFTNNPYIFKILSMKELKSLESNYEIILNLDLSYEKNRFLHITSAYSFMALGAHSSAISLQPELFLSKLDEKIIQTFQKEISGSYIVCHNRIDPTQPYRNVPIKDWEYLISELSSKTDLKIVQIGEKKFDVALTSSKQNLIDARGKFTLQQSKGLIDNAVLFLGTDAGPLHIAACTQTPIISFFTIAHHEVRSPLRSSKNIFVPITPDVSCYGCLNLFPFGTEWTCQRGDFACSSKFDIKKAINACLSIIQKND